MAQPTKKSPGVEAFLSAALGGPPPRGGWARVEAIKANLCTSCGGNADTFKDSLSLGEYTISGFCQTCQDKVWG